MYLVYVIQLDDHCSILSLKVHR